MKKITYTLLWTVIALVAATALGSCGASDTEKKLNGMWATQIVYPDEEGMTTVVDQAFAFNSEEMTCEIHYEVGLEGMGVMGILKCPGTWSAKERMIEFDFDSSRAEITFTDNFKLLAGIGGSDAAALEGELRDELLSVLGDIRRDEIVELTDTSLTLREETQTFTYTRL